jgi:hypothetical protein
MMIGWEFDTRISLDPRKEDDKPEHLGNFLNWVTKNRPELSIYMLEWDTGLVQTLGRGSTPLRILDWMFEPPRVYRRVFGSIVRLLFHQHSSFRRKPPLLLAA